jgi:hypothetical protein
LPASFYPLDIAFLAAVPVAAFLGACLASYGARSNSAVRPALSMAVGSVVLNAAVVGWAMLIEETTIQDGAVPGLFEVVLGGLLLGALGLLVFGWLAIVPAGLSAALWTYVMRRSFRASE